VVIDWIMREKGLSENDIVQLPDMANNNFAVMAPASGSCFVSGTLVVILSTTDQLWLEIFSNPETENCLRHNC